MAYREKADGYVSRVDSNRFLVISIKATGMLNMIMPGGRAARMAIIGMVMTASILITIFMVSFYDQPQEQATKPSLANDEPVKPVHIDFLVNKLGAGNLQAVAGLVETPKIEMLVTPDNSYFTVTVDDGVPTTRAGRADDPDIRLTGDREVIARLLSADDIFSEVRKLDQEGKVALEMLRDEQDLISIGYESLYNDLTK